MNRKALIFHIIILMISGFFLLLPDLAMAQEEPFEIQDFTTHWSGITIVILFLIAYGLVISEESLHLRKSKPMIVAAGLIWMIVALAYAMAGDTHTAGLAVKHNLLEFGELFLFLLAAMTYINTMDERGVFDMIRVWLISQEYSAKFSGSQARWRF